MQGVATVGQPGGPSTSSMHRGTDQPQPPHRLQGLDRGQQSLEGQTQTRPCPTPAQSLNPGPDPGPAQSHRPKRATTHSRSSCRTAEQMGGRHLPFRECSIFYPKFCSTIAYVRQRGRCVLCGRTITLSGALYYDTIPLRDPYWRRVYKTETKAEAAFFAMRGAMCRGSCRTCAPPTARARKAPLVPPSRLEGPATLVDFVIHHYSPLNATVPSCAGMAAWAERYRKETGDEMATGAFIAAVWGSMRRPLRAGRARQT